jgi:hypothetical protein
VRGTEHAGSGMESRQVRECRVEREASCLGLVKV